MNKKIAVIVYDEDREVVEKLLPSVSLYCFGKKEDSFSQAHNLFSILREADSCDYDEIYAPLPETAGVSLALYNRMIRAAAHKIIRL